MQETLVNKHVLSFEDFNNLIQKRFDYLQTNYTLFKSSVTGDKLWDTYLKSFRKGDDLVFRDPNSSYHNCNNDKNFIRRYGSVVAIDENYNILTMFDLVIPEESIYFEPAKALSKLLQAKISEVFFETYNELNSLPYEKTNKNLPRYQLGNSKSFKQYTPDEVNKYGVVTTDRVYEFSHFNVFLNKKFVKFGTESIESIRASYREPKEVFKRALEEIPLDTLELVRDLINQGSLLNGDSYLPKVIEFIKLKKEYNNIGSKQKDNYAWVKSYGLPYAKFRNELVGTLCVELAEGKELNKACLDWNKRADPVNYMKAKAPITTKQIEEAKKFVVENGYEESFDRRFATIDDINVDEILHSNIGSNKIKTASVFDNVKPSKSTRHKRSELENVEEVTIEKFMSDILPTATSIELFLENRFNGNLVSLITTKDKTAKNLFKWSNPFSWTYNGNLTGKSMIKDAVKEKGGLVDCALRFSIMWAENDPTDNTDLDAWCKEPNNVQIGYSTGFRKDRGNSRTSNGGQLDVDITSPSSFKNKNIVENISYIDLNQMKDGKYSFWVNMYSDRGSKGFKAEIEFNGEIYNYEFNGKFSGNKMIADVVLKNGQFTIEHKLEPSDEKSQELWNLETNNFHKVNLVCQSPNFWGENNIGNKHYFFMLDNCKSNVSLRSFHNEYLNSDLIQHRKVMEVLATQTMIEPADKQLSGVGFNSTVRDEVIVKVNGSFKRTLKIKF
jgi:hypothetical protein